MSCHRKYTFLFQDAPEGHDHIRQVLSQACDDHWWFSEPVVEGTDDMLVTFQVVGRDQWWAHRRAMELIESATYRYGYEIPVPTWESLPPHTNRGYSRVRK